MDGCVMERNENAFLSQQVHVIAVALALAGPDFLSIIGSRPCARLGNHGLSPGVLGSHGIWLGSWLDYASRIVDSWLLNLTFYLNSVLKQMRKFGRALHAWEYSPVFFGISE
jgi:hypothetical protein